MRKEWSYKSLKIEEGFKPGSRHQQMIHTIHKGGVMIVKLVSKCRPHLLKALALAAVLAGVGGGAASAEAAGKDGTTSSIFDRVWAMPVFYSDKSSPYVQKVALIGRYHGQYYSVDADEFGKDSDWDNRRARLGIKADLFRVVSFEGQMNIDVDGNRSGLFESVEDLYIDVKPWEAFGLLIGKHKPYLTREWNISSNRIKTMERSLLVNQIIPDKVYGLTALGKDGGLSWSAGVFSATYTERWKLPEFDGGYLVNLSLGYDVGKNGQVRLDYLYNNGDSRNFVATKPYEHAVSLNYNGTYGKLGLTADLIYGLGAGDVADVWGIVVMPHYSVTENLEGVFRYTYADSEAGDGIRLAGRYERQVDNLGVDRGDNYHSIYFGANYYIYGDRLKVMSGVEYSTADLGDGSDWDSWTWFGGVRFHF
jgi:phosphate-selective porin OprO and OprP